MIALLEGSDPHLKSQYIVVGAHYDHLPVKYGDSNEDNIYNGADDNASGVSSLIVATTDSVVRSVEATLVAF